MTSGDVEAPLTKIDFVQKAGGAEAVQARKQQYGKFYNTLLQLTKGTPDNIDQSGNITVSFQSDTEQPPVVTFALRITSDFSKGKPHSDWNAGLENVDEGEVQSMTFSLPDAMQSFDIVEQGIAMTVKNKQGASFQVPAIHLTSPKITDIIPNVIQPLINRRFGSDAPQL